MITMKSEALVKETMLTVSPSSGETWNWWIGSIAFSAATFKPRSGRLRAGRSSVVRWRAGRRRRNLVDVPETRRRPQRPEDDEEKRRGGKPSVKQPADQ